jgi:hypothetical protein
MISLAWGFNSKFNSTVEKQLSVNYKQITSAAIATSYFVCWGRDRNLYKIWAYFVSVFFRF